MTELLSAWRMARWSGSDNAGAAGGGGEEEEEGAGSAGGVAATAWMSALCPPEEENAAWCNGHVRVDRSHTGQKIGKKAVGRIGRRRYTRTIGIASVAPENRESRGIGYSVARMNIIFLTSGRQKHSCLSFLIFVAAL